MNTITAMAIVLGFLAGFLYPLWQRLSLRLDMWRIKRDMRRHGRL